MMTLPPGFDVSALVADFVDLALPFVEVAVLICAGWIILRILRRA